MNITPPNLTFETSMRLYFGGRELHLRYLGKAHTGGDTHIHLPDDNIVFCGDVAQDGGVPYLGDSYPDEWPNTDDRLVALPIERFVSGHGPVGEHSALEEARDFIYDLFGNLRTAISRRQERTGRRDFSGRRTHSLATEAGAASSASRRPSPTCTGRWREVGRSPAPGKYDLERDRGAQGQPTLASDCSQPLPGCH